MPSIIFFAKSHCRSANVFPTSGAVGVIRFDFAKFLFLIKKHLGRNIGDWQQNLLQYSLSPKKVVNRIKPTPTILQNTSAMYTGGKH